MGITQEIWFDPTFSLGVLVGQGMSPAATTGRDGCNTFSHPANFGALLCSAGSGTQAALGKLVAPGGLQTFFLFFFGESHPPKDLLISEAEVPPHLLPQFQNTSH